MKKTNVWETTLQTPKPEKEGEEVLRALEQVSTLQLAEDPMPDQMDIP